MFHFPRKMDVAGAAEESWGRLRVWASQQTQAEGPGLLNIPFATHSSIVRVLGTLSHGSVVTVGQCESKGWVWTPDSWWYTVAKLESQGPDYSARTNHKSHALRLGKDIRKLKLAVAISLSGNGYDLGMAEILEIQVWEKPYLLVSQHCCFLSSSPFASSRV